MNKSNEALRALFAKQSIERSSDCFVVPSESNGTPRNGYNAQKVLLFFIGSESHKAYPKENSCGISCSTISVSPDRPSMT
ncbi:MAG: hypothetical protein NTZ35_17455, partial [Ignavibacteriales bacterium]|nr:hypothetical protein [Ignavibacteriales bacterium]